MYLEFYNLKIPPFEGTPNPRFFFASEQHREALAAIEYTVRMRKGFVLITGCVGSGKTTVARTVCQRCSDEATIVQITPGRINASSIIRQILRHLGVEADSRDEHFDLIEQLHQQLMARLDEQCPVVLLVDEAQTLPDEALEGLRLLSNLDTATRKPIQIVLVGQPELRQRIRGTQFTALRQRIVMAKQLGPFELDETTQYILHRLKVSADDNQQTPDAFTDGAIREIHRVSEGVPRLINHLCDNCLLLGFVNETHQVSAAMVHRVAQDMVPSFEEATPPLDRLNPPLTLAGNM